MNDAVQPTPDVRRCGTRDDVVTALAELADTALRRVQVYAPALSDRLWSSVPATDAMRRFLTARGQREWHFLLEQTTGLASDHAALVSLAQRLPSLLLFRQADPDYALPARQAFVASDGGALLLFDADQRPGAVFTRADPGRARQLAEAHAQAWERARPVGELRQLGL